MKDTHDLPYEHTPHDVTVTRRDYVDGELFPWHTHGRGQFAYAACGVITVETEAGNWAVPPLRAIWVPADMGHAMQMRGPVTMLNSYISPTAAQRVGLPTYCQVFGVSTLLQQLLEKAVDVPLRYEQDGRESFLMGLLLHEIAVMPALSLNAPLPSEPRLAYACNAFLAAPSLEMSIDDMAKLAAMSRRTFTRLFRMHTGISFIEWRQQACLLAAVVRLGNGQSITRVAIELGYSSSSAFTSAFKSVLGEVPSRYFQRR
ncbi:AraC family transcriptional regulator [Alcaligenaceae bacterium 429]|nr:AraC family transcriptional regulator [Alcaligenaceae bacterium 429]